MLVEATGATGVLARHDARVRVLEGLERRVDVLHGEVPETIVVRDGTVEYVVDPRHGQKTGLFLDQRENRAAAASYASGRLLDCFSYHGGFALTLAPHCERVEAVDISADAVKAIPQCRAERPPEHRGAKRTSRRPAPPEKAGALHDRADPPAFAKNKASSKGACRLQGSTCGRCGYNPGGFLITCSCS
jgi:23S rRNA (cytosine1962-C5)-methyltransferase